VTGDPLSVVPLSEDLFRRAVTEPDAIDDRTLEDWMAEAAAAAGEPLSKGTARAMRRCVRDARKLAGYWSERDAASLPDWRNGVDEALGSRGWEPLLDLAREALDADPTPEAFEEVKRLHRTVHFTPWMEGVAFEEFVDGGG
jgi:hypothetical protein